MTDRRWLAVALCALLGLGTVVETARAERLPVRNYTTADGLAGDYITHIYRDARGFLWFSTRDGLSRFDGLRFTSYGIADGLPITTINQVLQTRAGVYWLATNGSGVCRFNAQGRRPGSAGLTGDRKRAAIQDGDALFTAYPVGDEPGTNRVNILYEDRAGRVWVGTDLGLFRMESEGGDLHFRRVNLPLLPGDTSFHGVHAIVEDAEGSLWVGGGWGLTRRLPDGRSVVHRVEPGGAQDSVTALLMADGKHLWVAFRRGLLMLDTAPASSFAAAVDPIVRTLNRSAAARIPAAGGVASSIEQGRWFGASDGLPHDRVTSLYRSTDGRVWAGTTEGLGELTGQRFRAYTTANGLTDNDITAVTGDSAGNLWIGSVAGVTRIINSGLVTYDAADGLGHPRVHALGEDERGNLYAVSGDYLVSRFDGKRFVSMRPDLPADARCMWSSPCGYLDRTGQWWMLTTGGLYQFAKATRPGQLAGQPPRAIHGRRSGLPDDTMRAMFEDAQGNVWIGTGPGGLGHWQRSNGNWRLYSEADGLPALSPGVTGVSAFAEDRRGALWVGLMDGGVARLWNGRFEPFGEADGVPAGTVTALHMDQAGRLWIASNQVGLARVDEPAAVRPRFVSLPLTDLSSGNVRCLTEDRLGRIYAGTSRGINRIDPASGRVKLFGAGEGLASEFVTSAFRDAQGILWFGTFSGVSRLDPSADSSPATAGVPPPVMISALRVRGVPQLVSELGEPHPPGLTLPPDQNQLEIEFFGVTFSSGERLKYQYRIDGIDADWSPATELRSVNYGRLPSGSHRFRVRSVLSEGVAGETPAVVDFTVLPPIYARWWFMTLSALLIGMAGLMVYRARVAQLLRVERVRARIATDLHDDIGASLSQIAILAEVARQGRDPAHDDTLDPLERIADTSRTLVDSMSDIVWAVDPEADSLGDLVHRMRRFAEDTLSASDIELTFRASDAREDLKLGADIRREIYLILKESVTNIAKHAECTSVTIEFRSDRHSLRLLVGDDGKGFDPAGSTDGNGVANMRRRVAALDGGLDIDSAPGRGTTIVLEIHHRSLAGLRQQFLPQ